MRSQATAGNPVKRSVMTYDGPGRRTTKVITNSGSNDWDAPYHFYCDGQQIVETRNVSRGGKELWTVVKFSSFSITSRNRRFPLTVDAGFNRLSSILVVTCLLAGSVDTDVSRRAMGRCF